MKIEYQQRDKLKNTAILFPLNELNLSSMIYIYKLINKRYKRSDYTCIYTSSSIKQGLDKIFNVVIKSNVENNIIDMIKDFIKTCTYRRVMIIHENSLFNINTGVILRLPIELPRKGMWFDLYNTNLTILTPSQRKSANRAYQTCRYTSMYLDIGKDKSKTRERIIKKYNKIEHLDDFIILKQKINLLEFKNEKINEDELLKLFKKYKKILSIIQFDKTKIYTQQSPGSYGIERSKKRDYSIVDTRIKEQIKIGIKKQADKLKKKKK